MSQHQARKLSVARDAFASGSAAGEAVQAHGAVIRAVGESFRVSTPCGEVDAKRAKSCLIEPIEGDYVLVSSSAGGAYVLAVLEREEGAAATIDFDGDLRIAPRGRLTLDAEEGIEIASAARVRIASSEVEVEASRVGLVANQLSVLGARLKAELAHVRVVGDAIDSVFQRVTQTMKRSFRIVEETDHVDARDVVWNAKENLSIHAGNAVLTSEELVKLDGNQIHLG